MDRAVVSADLAILYGEEAEEWNVYLKEVFSQHLNPHSVHSFQIDRLKDVQTVVPTLASCRCKFLVLTTGLLKKLSTPRRKLLRKVLQPPDTVVLLLCGVANSDELYELVRVQRGFREMLTDQEPWEYVSVVISIIESDTALEPEVSDPQPAKGVRDDPAGEHVLPNDFTDPLLVIPNHIECKSVTEVYLLLRGRLPVKEEPEVVFVTPTQQVMVQPSMCNSQTLCVRTPELPPGPVTLKLRCRGVVLGTARLVVFSPLERIERLLLRVTDPLEFLCQAFRITTQTELDELLTASLRDTLPPSGLGAFQSLATDSHSPPPCSEDHSHEIPTLLHFAARNGLEHLTALLLDCPGAVQASTLLNSHGERPGDMAERYGFQQLRQLLERFVGSSQRAETPSLQLCPERSTEDVPSREGGEHKDNIYETMMGPDSAASEHWEVSRPEDAGAEEGPYVGERPYTASGVKEDPCSMSAVRGDPETVSATEEDPYAMSTIEEDPYTVSVSGEDPNTVSVTEEDPYTVSVSREDPNTVSVTEEDPYTVSVTEEDPYTVSATEEDPYTVSATEEDPYNVSMSEEEEDPYDLVLPERKDSADERKENVTPLVSRPPAPIPRPDTLSQAPSTPFIAQVFQQRTGRVIDDRVYASPVRDVNRRGDIYSPATLVGRTHGTPKPPNLDPDL